MQITFYDILTLVKDTQTKVVFEATFQGVPFESRHAAHYFMGLENNQLLQYQVKSIWADRDGLLHICI